MSQILIKVLLISGLLLVALKMLRSSGGDRSTAFRRIALLCFFALAIFTVLFPVVLSGVANFIGVGRGTDLLLYAFIVVFISYLFSNARQRRSTEIQITRLARLEALRSALAPNKQSKQTEN